jgi:uncharacterized protein (TIGR02453 family)
MARHVEVVSSHLTASDRKVGGSLMRIHRDVRFARDKRPYKTNLGIQFRHTDGRDVHAPGLYLHVDPESVFLGAGMWRPPPPALRAIRDAIGDEPKGWARVRDGKTFRKAWALAGESLTRAPRGVAPDHPMIEDLRRKDHIAVSELTHVDVTRSDLIPFVTRRFRDARPYMAWLAAAVGLPF